MKGIGGQLEVGCCWEGRDLTHALRKPYTQKSTACSCY